MRNRCTAFTKSGKQCRGWAMPNSDKCSIHLGKTYKKTGPNVGNKLYQLYAKHFSEQEYADLIAFAQDDDPLDEIAVARVLMQRILEALAELQEEGQLTVAKLQTIVNMTNDTMRTVGRLMRDRRALSGKSGDSIADAISSAIDELSNEWMNYG